MKNEYYELLEGDCLERMKEIPNGSIDMVMCDLPYGTTRNAWDSIIPLDALWSEYRRVCKKNAAIVLTTAQPFTSVVVMSNMAGFKYDWVWHKEAGTGLLNAKKQPLRDHESILVFYDSQCTYNPQFTKGKPYTCKKGGDTSNYNPSGQVVTVNEGTRCPKTVQFFQRDKGKVHPTQKPVALMEYLIRTYTNPGELVLDNTMGSGTTGVACMNTGRRFVGIERDENYFKIAEARIEKARSESPIFAFEV